MEAYITGLGIISPQKTFDTEDFLSDVVEYNSSAIRCIEPSYKDLLNPAMARRMGRVIKMGIAASGVCLKDAGIQMPDAIMTGTALGCHEDTEKFLLSILENNEQFLTPTSFIQSTHNTVSAQIALQIKCLNYNFTYVHKGFSFESALLDGLMTIAEGEAKNVLVGGHDEMTDRQFKITSRVGYWKETDIPAMRLINSKTNGSVSGEGASFFILSNKPGGQNYAKLLGVKMIYKPQSISVVEEKINELLKEKGLTALDIDVAIYGISGDVRYDHLYDTIRNGMLKNSTATYYKHLSGEYQTSASFAMWMAAKILKTQSIPEALLVGENKCKPIKHVLIYNSSMNIDHAVFLLSSC